MSRQIRARASVAARFETLETRAMLTTLTVNGTAGDDAIALYYNGPDYVVRVNGVESLHPSAPVTAIVINGLGGADAISVFVSGDPVQVAGGDGNDSCEVGQFTMGFIQSPVTFDGGAGNDSLRLNDDGATGFPNYGVNATHVQGDFANVNFTSAENLTLNAADDGSVIFVNSTVPGSLVRLNTGGGVDDFQIASTGAGSTVVIDSSTGLGQPDIINVTGTAAVELASSQHFSSFRVAAPSRVKLQPGRDKALKIDANETNNSQVDLTDNVLIHNYSGQPGPDLFAINFVSMPAAYAGGTWTGPGITSSSAAANPALAIGIAEATELFPSTPVTFMGVSVDDTAIVLKTTLVGDANLDGTVNLQDFNRLATNFGRQAMWSEGNFNYSSRADLADFNLLAGQFGNVFAATAAAAAATSASPGTGIADDLGDWLA